MDAGLNGFHHAKVPATDVVRSRDRYQRGLHDPDGIEIRLSMPAAEDPEVPS